MRASSENIERSAYFNYFESVPITAKLKFYGNLIKDDNSNKLLLPLLFFRKLSLVYFDTSLVYAVIDGRVFHFTVKNISILLQIKITFERTT